MKHAGPSALDALEPLLAELRALDGLVEKKRGTFYRRSAAFLHFHEDAAGLFADLKQGDDWDRLRVSTARERKALLRRAKATLAGTPRSRD
jgi:hypothetical protein